MAVELGVCQYKAMDNDRHISQVQACQVLLANSKQLLCYCHIIESRFHLVMQAELSYRFLCTKHASGRDRCKSRSES